MSTMKTNRRTAVKAACKLYKDEEMNNYYINFMFLLTSCILKNQHIPCIASRNHKTNSIIMSTIMINIPVQ